MKHTRSAAPAGSFAGWRIVAVAFLTQAVAIGFTMGIYTLFVRPFEEAFGLTRERAMIGMSLMFLTMGVSLVFIGRALDRRSARAIMLTGALLNAGCLVLLSLATQLWQVAVLCVGLGLGVAMLGPVASSTVVASWFEEKRGQALGLANMGAPAGPFFIAPVATVAIGALGWRPTLVWFGVLTLLLAVPAIWLVIVNRPSDVGQQPDGRPAASPAGPGAAARAAPGPEWGFRRIASSAYFWTMALTIGIVLAGPIVLSGHLEPYCHSLGIERGSVGLLLMLLAVATIVGTVLFGTLADRFDLRRLLWTSMALQAACWAFLLTRPSLVPLAAALSIFALCAGATMPIYGSLIARHFGPAAFGAVMGTAGLVMLPIHVAAPPLSGRLYEINGGDYGLMIQAVIGSLAVAALTLGFLRPAAPAPAAARSSA